MVREKNETTGAYTTWTYDNAGNILSRTEYNSAGTATGTVTYTYGNSDWGDLLMKYNGQSTTYDTNGNPLNDGTWKYTWRHGRQLETMTAVDGSAAWTYTYNADGLRLSRTDGTTEYNYVYLGGQLVYMTIGDSVTMKFNYDANGAPVAVQYNGTTYYYITNLQGDIVGIVNQAGTRIVSYTYDAWGNLLSTTTSGTTNANNLANNNPLRYRGYIYDNETGLYYLQSRYYDPEVGRFLGADVVYDYDAGLQGYNLFIYCGNNPVNRIDMSGADSSELNGCKDLLDDPLLEGGGGGNGSPSSGGGSGSLLSAFRQTIKDAMNGLSQAGGEKSGFQGHHMFSNKNRTYTPQFEEITSQYGLDLNDDWNIVQSPNHSGRHTNAYHDFMLFSLHEIDRYAQGDTDLFLYAFDELVAIIYDNTWVFYAR